LMWFTKTKNIVASSAAALVSERFIGGHTETSQQPFLKKCHFSQTQQTAIPNA
jgi:hypothetical protein